MILKRDLRSGEQSVKMDLSSTLRCTCRVGWLEGRTFHVFCSAMGPELEEVPFEVVSVGPVTLRIASKTLISSSL
jgi:hypothetical protein